MFLEVTKVCRKIASFICKHYVILYKGVVQSLQIPWDYCVWLLRYQCKIYYSVVASVHFLVTMLFALWHPWCKGTERLVSTAVRGAGQTHAFSWLLACRVITSQPLLQLVGNTSQWECPLWATGVGSSASVLCVQGVRLTVRTKYDFRKYLKIQYQLSAVSPPLYRWQGDKQRTLVFLFLI